MRTSNCEIAAEGMTPEWLSGRLDAVSVAKAGRIKEAVALSRRSLAIIAFLVFILVLHLN